MPWISGKTSGPQEAAGQHLHWDHFMEGVQAKIFKLRLERAFIRTHLLKTQDDSGWLGLAPASAQCLRLSKGDGAGCCRKSLFGERVWSLILGVPGLAASTGPAR